MGVESTRTTRSNEAPGSHVVWSSESVPAPFPKHIELALAKLTERPPRGGDWVHEVKFDGYRLAARLKDGAVQLITRNGLDWTDRFPSVAAAVKELGAETAVLDGEVIAVGADGKPDFGALQRAAQPRSANPRAGRARLSYQVFDLLYMDGRDYRPAPLEERKAALRRLLQGVRGALRYTDHLEVSGTDVYEHACRLGLEGVVSKQLGSPYRSGRTDDWLKTTCLQTDDLVVGGFTGPRGSRTGFGALLLGRPVPGGGLRFVGKVGTGFGRGGIAALAERLDPITTDISPFVERLPADAIRTGVTWVEPRLVVEVAYSGVTDGGRLRHPRYGHLREDKDPSEVAPAPADADHVPLAASDPDDEAGEHGGESVAEPVVKRGKSEAEVAGVRLTNAGRVLYPEQGVTKLDLAEYYAAVGEELLRRAARRPLALVRCPEGTAQQCFYQKHPGPSFAPGLPRIPIQEKEDVDDYVYLESVSDLVSLVQLGVLEVHAWGSTVDHLEQPDILVFDLDPGPGVKLDYVKTVARRLRDLLTRLGLGAFLRATGGKGLHVVVPLTPEADWDEVKGFAKAIADALAASDPDRLTTNLSKSKRDGKVFVDYLRNGRGSTAIVNYSTRSREGAPVAVPLRWEELGRLEHPGAYDVAGARKRLAALKQDPWEGFEESAVPLSRALASLSDLEPPS